MNNGSSNLLGNPSFGGLNQRPNLEMGSFPNNKTSFSQINKYSMPTVMFNEPHIPIILPTQANFMGEYEKFQTVLENVKKAQKIADYLEYEREKLKSADDCKYHDLVLQRMG